jgi:hypothetical protein
MCLTPATFMGVAISVTILVIFFYPQPEYHWNKNFKLKRISFIYVIYLLKKIESQLPKIPLWSREEIEGIIMVPQISRHCGIVEWLGNEEPGENCLILPLPLIFCITSVNWVTLTVFSLIITEVRIIKLSSPQTQRDIKKCYCI